MFLENVSRIWVDLFVVFAHLVSVFGIYFNDSQQTLPTPGNALAEITPTLSTLPENTLSSVLLQEKFIDTKAGQIILAMEIITMVFHAYYVIKLIMSPRDRSDPDWNESFASQFNPYKWLEYAVSATLGTIATAYMKNDTEADADLILLLCAAGIAQQAQGYLLENELKTNSIRPDHVTVSFLSAVLLQIGEFLVVYNVIPDKSSLTIKLAYANYVIGYSYFGVIMLMCFVFKNGGFKQVVEESTWEKIYSIAGLFAKLAILYSDYAVYWELRGTPKEELAISTTVLLTGFIPFVYFVYFIWTKCRPSSSSGKYNAY